MSTEPRLFRIDPENRKPAPVTEVDFAQMGLRERRDIQEWVAAHPGILGDDLLIVGKEFSGFDRTNERLDLLAVDRAGRLVVIELKRDDSGTDAHWQAIKYASYLQRASTSDIVKLTADSHGCSLEEAELRLLQHLGTDDLTVLNNDQRIILASHRFAPEETSAALWLNRKAPGEDLITCVTLTPYRDAMTGTLYLQASTLIPVPGIDDYLIAIGEGAQPGGDAGPSTQGAKLQASFARNINDEVTPFLRRVGEVAISGLADDVRPDRTSRWGAGGPDFRYYHIWYARPPWSNWGTSYRINLYPEDATGSWRADVEFRHNHPDLAGNLSAVRLHGDQVMNREGVAATLGTGMLGDEFGDRIAEVVRSFIATITPIVNDLGNEDIAAADVP